MHIFISKPTCKIYIAGFNYFRTVTHAAMGGKLTSSETSMQNEGDDGESNNGEGQEEKNLRIRKRQNL